MVFKNPEFSSNSPYYDDFDDTKNFLKILFKPGYAVQARELTQLQSILQSQISKFADHVFQDGSQVFGGKIQITSTPYFRAERVLYGVAGAITALSDDYLNNLSSNLLKVYKKTGSIFEELATIKLSYFETSNYSTNDNFPVVFYNTVSVADSQNGLFDMQRDLYVGSSPVGPFIKVINPIQQEVNPVQYKINPFGQGYLITVDDGIFYIDGYFVKTEKQTIALYNKSDAGQSEITKETNLTYAWADSAVRLFNKPSSRIGYRINREIITASQDNTLKDPARGFYNHNAPGADRYKISLNLETIDYDNQSVEIDNYVTENFIQILRTTNGVVDYIKNKSSYAQIMELFARRTQDESGSYTITPFIADVKNHLRKDKYTLTVSSASNEIFFRDRILTATVGAYIWPANQKAFNPFTATTFDNLKFPIGKVVDVLVDYNIDSVEAESKKTVIKFVVEMQNQQKFAATPNLSYFFRQSGAANARVSTIRAETTESAIDPKGLYSFSDVPKGDSNKLGITLQQGKAYVYGYEYETFAPRVIEYSINGNQNPVKTMSGLNIDFELGNYIYGSFSAKDSNQTLNINYEELPLVQLVDENTNTLLIYPNAESQVSSKILAWAPFKHTNDPTVDDLVDAKLLYSGNPQAMYEHESILFVEEIQDT